MQLQFLGATQTVTGSKYLIKTKEKTILIDCGLFQGHKELRLRNWDTLPVNPKEIDALILTHAHIDHSGYIPLLVKHGFKGPIYCTEATRDLCEILLPDSGHLHEEEAYYANKKHFSKHAPALPLYTREDAENCLGLFIAIPFNHPHLINHHLQFTFHPVGHILGAAYIHLEEEGVSLLCSGDVGRPNDPLLYPPQKPVNADYVLVESTYGNRQHPKDSAQQELAQIINTTYHQGGSVLIPSFAVGRAQSILYELYQLKLSKQIPDIPVYVDSPMATDVTRLFYQHANLHKLNKTEALAVCQTANYIQSVEESKALSHLKTPAIIISASGMATGGRVLHHLRHLAPDRKNAIVFCGFQAGGTRGDRIVRGEPEVKMLGTLVPIHASVFNISSFSAHADAVELLSWLSSMEKAPKKVFVTHGEPEASQALAEKIKTELRWDCEVPHYLEKVDL